MNATILAIIVGLFILGAGVLVNLDLVSNSYAQTAIGTILGGAIGGTGGFALGKKQGQDEKGGPP